MQTPTPTKCIQSTPHTIPRHENVIYTSLPLPHPISEPLSLTPLNRSNSSQSAFFHTQYPLGFFMQTPTPTKCIQSTTHTIPRHENVIYTSLPPPHSISEPLSLTPLNRSNSSQSAFSISNDPPGFFYADPHPNQMYPVNYPHDPRGSLDMEKCTLATI